MLEQLARDKEERFGKKFDPNTGTVKKEVTEFENVSHYVKSIKTLYPSFRNGDTAKNCLSTMKIIISNILKNPNEEKFKKVKITNPNFQERVGKILLAMKCFSHLGFKEDGEYLVISKSDNDLLEKSFNLIEDELKSFN